MTTTTDAPSTQPRATSHLGIEGALTVARAGELKQALLALLALLAPQSAAELDLSGVREIDTAGLQLLLFALQTARERNVELRLTAASDPVRSMFELLRLPHLTEPAPVEAADESAP